MDADDHQVVDGIKESMSDAEDDKDDDKVNFVGGAGGQGGVRTDAPWRMLPWLIGTPLRPPRP